MTDLAAVFSRLQLAAAATKRQNRVYDAPRRQALARAVAECRQAGLSWREIGEGLGMSRQAAWARWGGRQERA